MEVMLNLVKRIRNASLVVVGFFVLLFSAKVTEEATSIIGVSAAHADAPSSTSSTSSAEGSTSSTSDGSSDSASSGCDCGSDTGGDG